jgi:diguanylate cyclase (GGDEF)-like protein
MVMVITVGAGLSVDLIHSEQFEWVWTPYVNAVLRLIVYTFMILIQDRLKTEATNARVDSLTGLLNRRAFWEITEDEVERCKRHNRPVSIAYVDVDDFKLINDKYGHRTGDRFLMTLAKTLNKGSRITDKVARLGGDEFAILMPETAESGAKTVSDRLSRLTQVMNQQLFSITVSIGIATFLKAPANAEGLISEADRLMYLSKKNGKNRIESAVIS